MTARHSTGTRKVAECPAPHLDFETAAKTARVVATILHDNLAASFSLRRGQKDSSQVAKEKVKFQEAK